MCDQDHFDKDQQDFEAQGMVTRRQFGVLVGAGIALMLPKVAQAVAVTESDVTVKTPDGMCDSYFVHPATGTAPGVLVWPDIFGLRPAFRQMNFLRQYVSFLALCSLGAVIQLTLVFVFVEYSHIQYAISLVMAVCVASLSNFLLNKKITFGEKIWE
jgi:hypothetical protein